jgi:glycerophosphoryl diester phosphodiesterase
MSVGSRWQRSLASRVLDRGWSDGIVIHDRLADPAFLASTTPSVPVVVWAVEDRERARSLISQGVAGLILDSATLISEVRADIASNGQYADPS